MSTTTRQCRFSALAGTGMQAVSYRGEYVGTVRHGRDGWEAIRRRGGSLPGVYASRSAAATALVEIRQGVDDTSRTAVDEMPSEAVNIVGVAQLVRSSALGAETSLRMLGTCLAPDAVAAVRAEVVALDAADAVNGGVAL